MDRLLAQRGDREGLPECLIVPLAVEQDLMTPDAHPSPGARVEHLDPDRPGQPGGLQREGRVGGNGRLQCRRPPAAVRGGIGDDEPDLGRELLGPVTGVGDASPARRLLEGGDDPQVGPPGGAAGPRGIDLAADPEGSKGRRASATTQRTRRPVASMASRADGAGLVSRMTYPTMVWVRASR